MAAGIARVGDETVMKTAGWFWGFSMYVCLACGPFRTLLADGPTLGLSLDALFDPRGGMWGIGREQFMNRFGGYGFRWLSSGTGNTALARNENLCLLSLSVVEADAVFGDSGLKEVGVLFYSRGDVGDVPAERFEDMVNVTEQRLTEWTGVRPSTVVDTLKTAGVSREARVWTCKGSQYKLEWSVSTGSRSRDAGGIRPEFLRLRCQPADSPDDFRSALKSVAASRSRSVSLAGLKGNVRVEENGDVFISNFPMVDQGKKGYCAAAVTERVMRYYGRELDQHDMAQLAGTSAQQGTDPRSMLQTLRSLGTAFGCKVMVHEEFTVNNFFRLVEKYNREAKQRGLDEIKLGNEIDVNAVFQKMDTDALRAARTKNQADMKNFVSKVDSYVRRGIPLAWSVVIGKVAENPPLDGFGGHLRLIIGQNARNGEILYTDSWGAGHELKRMKTADAWTITQGLYTIEPLRTTL